MIVLWGYTILKDKEAVFRKIEIEVKFIDRIAIEHYIDLQIAKHNGNDAVIFTKTK